MLRVECGEIEFGLCKIKKDTVFGWKLNSECNFEVVSDGSYALERSMKIAMI